MAGTAALLHPALSWVVLFCALLDLRDLAHVKFLLHDHAQQEVRHHLRSRERHRLRLISKREWARFRAKGPMRWFSFERAMPFMFMLGYVVFFAYQTTMAELDTMFREGWAPILRLLQAVGGELAPERAASVAGSLAARDFP